VTKNKKSIYFTNLTIEKKHYAIIYKSIQLINIVQRVKEKYNITIKKRNNKFVKKFRTSTYYLKNKVSNKKELSKKRY